jgi:hypothetical protein
MKRKARPGGNRDGLGRLRKVIGMRQITRGPAAGKPRVTTAHVLVPADRLRDLARKGERLGVSGGTDPETIIIAKFSVAAELRQLARELGP